MWIIIKCLELTARPIELMMLTTVKIIRRGNRINFPACVKSRENTDNSLAIALSASDAWRRRGTVAASIAVIIAGISYNARNESCCRIYKRIVFAEFDRAGERAGNNSVPRHPDVVASLALKYTVLRVYPRCEKNAIFVNLYFYQIRRQFTWAGMLIECDSDKLIANVFAWK